MDIFESLENLNVSEECFEDIVGLVEELINETVWDQIRKVHGNSDKAEELVRKANENKKKDSADQVQREFNNLVPKNYRFRNKSATSPEEALEYDKKRKSDIKRVITDDIKAHQITKNKEGERKTDERRALGDDYNPYGLYKYGDLKNIANNPRGAFKEKWGDNIGTHSNYTIENKIKDQAMKKLNNYMNSKESLLENIETILEDIANLRKLAGIKGRGWDKEDDPKKERLRKKLGELEYISDLEGRERRKRWPEGLADSIRQDSDSSMRPAAKLRDEGKDTKNWVGMLKTKKRHKNRSLFNTNTGYSGIKVGPDSWVGADEPTRKDIERYNPVVKSIARNMKKSYKSN